MRKFKCLLLLAFIGLTTSAFGQSIWNTVNTDGYNRIYVGYNGVKAKVDWPGGDDLKYPGFSIGYLRGIGLTQKVPLYLEVGGELVYNSHKEDYYDDYEEATYEQKETIFALKIPVSLAYRLNINENFSITPRFGFDFRLNLMGKAKYEYAGESDDWNLFDDDEMDGEAYKRFQAGWHIGVGFDYKAIHVGVDYGTSFNEISEKVKLATTSVVVGWNF